jgi:hypothetical protein
MRIRVRLSEIFTSISDVLPDPIMDLSRALLITLAARTNKNAAPKSLGLLLSEIIFFSF